MVIGPRDEVGDPRRAEREDRQPDRHAVGRLVPPRVAEHVDGHADEDDGQNVGDDAERAGRDGVDDVPEHAGQPPPLPRSDDDAEGEEGKTEPVATVFGFEVRSGGADAAVAAALEACAAHTTAMRQLGTWPRAAR